MPRSLIFPVSLQNLPVEVICIILDNLEMHDLLTCLIVAKHLSRVIVESSRLQYKIELEKNRMVSLLPASAALPYSTRLKLIRDRERAWKYMDWKKRHTLKLPPTGSVYEFVGGLYGNGREDESRITASISFLELPSADAIFLGEPEQELETWTHDMHDVSIIDFTMDPSQDLLVLVALAPPDSTHVYELHLRSIKTNQPHAKAPIAVLPCWKKPAVYLPSSDAIAAVRIQISGDLVALLIKDVLESSDAHLEIWNWEKNPQSSCALKRPSEIDDFTFLTQDSFLLVRPTGQFQVYTFEDPSTHPKYPEPKLRITYSFPPLTPGYDYWYISMSSNPAPGYIPRPSTGLSNQGTIPSSAKQIYYPHPEERIHACCLYLFNSQNEENASVFSFVFFLNLKTLLNPPAEWISKANATSATENVRQGADSAPQAHAGSPTTSSSSPSSSSALDSDPHPFRSSPLTSSPPMEFSNLNSYNSNLPSSSVSSNAHLYPAFPTFDGSTSPTTSAGPSFSGRRTQATLTKVSPVYSAGPSAESGRRARTRPTQSSIASIPPDTDIPWDVWGPQSTRWFEECINTDWQHAIYGLRTVESVRTHPRSGAPILPANIPREIIPPRPPAAARKSACSISPEPTGLYERAYAVGHASGSYAQIHYVNTSTTDPATTSAPDSIEHSLAPQHAFSLAPIQPELPSSHRYLRLRDFNPYAFADEAGAIVQDLSKEKISPKSFWVEPRLVTEASTTPVKGVFKHNIVSSLPYMEVISREPFEVTDVMMDDSRLLLLKRGQSGRLKHVDVLLL